MQRNVFMSVELNQQITAHIDGCISCFYVLLCSYGYTRNGRQSTHYAIIDLNSNTRSIHSNFMESHAVRRRGENVHPFLFCLIYIQTVITMVIWLVNYRHPKFHDLHRSTYAHHMSATEGHATA